MSSSYLKFVFKLEKRKIFLSSISGMKTTFDCKFDHVLQKAHVKIYLLTNFQVNIFKIQQVMAILSWTLPGFFMKWV